MRAAFLIWSSLLILAYPIALKAQEGSRVPGMVLQKDEAAPERGVFFSGEALISLVNALQELDFLQKQSNVLKEWTKAKDDQITALGDAMKALEQARQHTDEALTAAEKIIQNQKKIIHILAESMYSIRETDTKSRAGVLLKAVCQTMGLDVKEFQISAHIPRGIGIALTCDKTASP